MKNDLKELEEYRSIGSIPRLKYLKELNTPLKVAKWADGTYHCPNCEAPVNWAENCVCCCQRVEWSD